MSSIANCHNHSTSAPLSESDNDDENEFNASFNRQNESMMHKVKDVVSKLLHPSFLFSTNDDTNRPKRKRSTSVEEHDNEQQTTTITTNTTNNYTTTSRSKYGHSSIRDDEPQLTDDEDNNSRGVPSNEQDLTEIEQQKKRRRTANYQNILPTKTTNGHHDHDDRIFSPLTSTDSIRSLSNLRLDHTSNRTPVLLQTSIEQNPNERINRLTSSKQRFNLLPTYRGSTSNYDPSKSPLFSTGNRKTTETRTNLKSNEFSANYLLASGLVARPQPPSSNSQQSPATLTHPITNTNSNRLLSNERQMLGANYTSINSRRLPYIERLRRRTLQDCIRLNRTVDSEPLSVSIIEEHKSTTASPVLKRTRVPEKECGIQCDISTVENSIEPSKKVQHTFPPVDIRNEALSVPTTEKTQSFSQTDSSIQTNSSITIEKIQPSVPIINITKPKVLGDVTPFSWPKFARAQEEYAKKYPEKCRTDAVPTKSVVPSVIEKSNVNIIPAVLQHTKTSASTIPKMPTFPFSSSRPSESIWKCPSCTKEHPVQTASCSLCHGINPNYKKPSAIESTKTIEKQPVSSSNLPDVIVKEPSIPVPSTNQIIPTTTKENVLSIPPVVTTSATSTTFPLFRATPITSLPLTTKENTTTITAPIATSSTTSLFGTTPIVSSIITTKENPVITTASITTSSITPLFGTAPIVSPSTTTIQATPVSTSAARPLFGITPIVSPTPITTKENLATTSTPPLFGTTTFDKTSTTNANSPFQVGTPFQPFPLVPSTSLTTAVTSSIVPSISTITPSVPTATSSQASTSTPFGSFGSTSIITNATPVVVTVSSDQPPAFTFTPNTSAPFLTTSTATSSNLFSSSTITPAPAVTTTTVSFPTSSPTNAFTIPGNFTFTPATTTSTSSLFGSGGLNLPPASTTITPSNPPFGFGAGSSPTPFTPAAVSSMNSTSAPSFGTTASFGTVTPFGTAAPFGITPASVDRPASSVSSFLSSGTSNAPPSFGFGSTPNITQTSAVPVASTSSFSFASPSSTVPVFGAGPPALSSSGPLNTFNFGATPAASTTNTLFQFSGIASTPMANNPFPTPMNNDPFSTPISSGSTVDLSNPYSIGSEETTNSRPILKAKRRRP